VANLGNLHAQFLRESKAADEKAENGRFFAALLRKIKACDRERHVSIVAGQSHLHRYRATPAQFMLTHFEIHWRPCRRGGDRLKLLSEQVS
jgi:hypothetical protein